MCIITATEILGNNQREISAFSNNPGIYFETEGTVNLFTSHWNMVIYYDLASYDYELAGFKSCMEELVKLCKQIKVINPSINHCDMTNKLLATHLAELTNYHEALYSHSTFSPFKKAVSRKSRSLFDAGGSALHFAFGVLDQQSASLYNDQIKNLQMDQDYMFELLKNHTSILDSSAHVLKRTEETLNHQFEVFQQHLNRIEIDSDHAQVRLERTRGLNDLSTYTILLLIRFRDTQKALLDLLTGNEHGILNPLIVSRQTMSEQLLNVQNNLPKQLSLPKIGNNHIDLATISKLAQTKTRLTNGKIIIEIRLPLISTEDYQLYHLIPVPTKVDDHYLFIQPAHDYLIVNLLRERYTSLDANEFKKCSRSTDGTYICNTHYPIYTANSKNLRCEMELLNHPHEIPETCVLTRTTDNRFWIPLNNNRFIFVLDKKSMVDQICGPSVVPFELSGSGIIEFKKGCYLRNEDTIIMPTEYNNNSVSASYYPSFNISSLNFDSLKLNATKIYSNQIISSPLSDNRLIQLIEQQKNSEVTLPSKVNHHNIIHYSMNAFLWICIIMIILFIYYSKNFSFTEICRKTAKTSEVHPLETIYSMPTSPPKPSIRIIVPEDPSILS